MSAPCPIVSSRFDPVVADSDLRSPHVPIAVADFVALAPAPGVLFVERVPEAAPGSVEAVQSTDALRRTPCRARVLKVGPPAADRRTGRIRPLPIRPGDWVYIPRFAGHDTRITGASTPSGRRDVVCIDDVEVLLWRPGTDAERAEYADAFKV